MPTARPRDNRPRTIHHEPQHHRSAAPELVTTTRAMPGTVHRITAGQLTAEHCKRRVVAAGISGHLTAISTPTGPGDRWRVLTIACATQSAPGDPGPRDKSHYVRVPMRTVAVLELHP